jgi:hypothetical protein
LRTLLDKLYPARNSLNEVKKGLFSFSSPSSSVRKFSGDIFKQGDLNLLDFVRVRAPIKQGLRIQAVRSPEGLFLNLIEPWLI